ncbi:MAG: DUF5119 domain-containing protein [Prevotella sp.]|jgi:hypothetical protein|nr:DUF5119 domain-containing protein [Prevotella sp.]
MIVVYAMSLIVPAMAFSGCDTRREIFEDQSIWVRVRLNWTPADIVPEGTSIYFYPHEQGRQPVVLLTNDMLDSIRLPKGNYSVLAFNETVNGHDHISFRGTDKYDTFEAYASTPVTFSGRYAKSSGAPAVAVPDILAAAHLDRFDVTREMVLQDMRPTVELTPRRLLSKLFVTIHIKGLDNCSKSGHVASIGGMAESVYLATETVGSVPVTHYFTLNNRTFYPGSETDGTMSATFETFGLADMPLTMQPANVRNMLSLYFRLRDGSDFPVIEQDVGDFIVREEGTMQMRLILTVGNTGNPAVVLPDVPDISEDSGFTADVDDWGEQEEVPVPLE